MKDQIDGYVRTLENRAKAAIHHHRSQMNGDAVSHGEFMAYVRVISDFTGEDAGKVCTSKNRVILPSVGIVGAIVF